MTLRPTPLSAAHLLQLRLAPCSPSPASCATTNFPPPTARLRSVELCRSTGRRLRTFSLGHCEGGPHEFRGVLRANLLRALAARLAPGSLLTGCPVDRVESTPQGAALDLVPVGRVGCLAVVGADGARSVAAAALGRGAARYVGQSAIRCVRQGNGTVGPPACHVFLPHLLCHLPCRVTGSAESCWAGSSLSVGGCGGLSAGLCANACCRGIAVYPEGVPCSVIRQVWGEGPRAGAYPISGVDHARTLRDVGSLPAWGLFMHGARGLPWALLCHGYKTQLRYCLTPCPTLCVQTRSSTGLCALTRRPGPLLPAYQRWCGRRRWRRWQGGGGGWRRRCGGRLLRLSRAAGLWTGERELGALGTFCCAGEQGGGLRNTHCSSGELQWPVSG